MVQTGPQNPHHVIPFTCPSAPLLRRAGCHACLGLSRTRASADPRVVDRLAVARTVGPGGEELEAVPPGLERPGHARRHPDRVVAPNLDQFRVELDLAA